MYAKEAISKICHITIGEIDPWDPKLFLFLFKLALGTEKGVKSIFCNCV